MTQTQHWPDFDRVLIVELSSNGKELAGTIQLELYTDHQRFGGTAYAYALWVTEKYRRYLVGDRLLQEAERIAKERGHKALFIKWSSEESPRWILEWYARKGYEEKEFSPLKASLLCKYLIGEEK